MHVMYSIHKAENTTNNGRKSGTETITPIVYTGKGKSITHISHQLYTKRT